MKIVRDEPIIELPKEMIFELKSDHKLINPNQLKIAMNYRGYNQVKLAKNFKGISQSALSLFLKGERNRISLDKLKLIMEFLDFPMEFLYKNIKPVKSSLYF